MGQEEVTSNTQHVPTLACKVTDVRVCGHAYQPSHMRETLAPVNLHAKGGRC